MLAAASSAVLGSRSRISAVTGRRSRLRHSGLRVLACGAAQVALLYLLWMVLGAPFALPLVSSRGRDFWSGDCGTMSAA